MNEQERIDRFVNNHDKHYHALILWLQSHKKMAIVEQKHISEDAEIDDYEVIDGNAFDLCSMLSEGSTVAHEIWNKHKDSWKAKIKPKVEKSKKNATTINLGEELFSFDTFQSWVNNASTWFNGVRKPYICIDSKNRVCYVGTQFMRARDEDAFPVTVYRQTF